MEFSEFEFLFLTYRRRRYVGQMTALFVALSLSILPGEAVGGHPGYTKKKASNRLIIVITLFKVNLNIVSLNATVGPTPSQNGHFS